MESWKVDYFYRRGEAELVHDVREIQLPDDYYASAKEWLAKIGRGNREGVILKVRDWGVCLVLEGFSIDDMVFDLPQGTPRKGQTSDFEVYATPKGEVAAITTGEPLGDTKVLGSKEHPFRIYAPDGKLMGTYTDWDDFQTKTEEAKQQAELEALVQRWHSQKK